MRKIAIATVTAASLAVMTAPAQAAWHSYVSHQLGFSFEAPGEVKSTIGLERGEIAGPRETTLFRSVDDNIDYRVTVVNFPQAQADGADLLGEQAYNFSNNKKVLMDTFGRVEPGKEAIYGRKITIDLPNNGGRALAAFYFTKGRLYIMRATVLPANGDYATPDAGRFIDSVTFNLDRADKSSTELKIPPPD
jgi:hypothetical protein